MSLSAAISAFPPARTRPRDRSRDGRGLVVCNLPREALALVDEFCDAILRRGRNVSVASRLATLAPGAPIAQAYAAAYHLLSDTRAGFARAWAHLDRARENLAGASERERLLVDALVAIAEDRPLAAEAAFLALGKVAPDDVASAYIGQLHMLNHGRFEAMIALARRVVAANPGDPFALGMLSFALEENGDIAGAEKAGMDACAIDRAVPWAHHALAHVFGEQGRIDDGVAFLEAHRATWDACGTSMFTHNWWHLALLRIDRGEPATVLASYDSHFAAPALKDVSSFVNAASLLGRLELHGVDVGERWEPLAAAAEARIGEHVLAFIDLHDMLALARAGRARDTASLLSSAQRFASGAPVEGREAWMKAGLPLLRAVSAYGLGDVMGARQDFSAGMPHAALVGGSGAQRILFESLAVAAERGRREADGFRQHRHGGIR